MVVMTASQAEALGPQVEARRTRLGMSVESLAERAGLKPATLSAIEAGVPNVRAATTESLVKALDRLEDEKDRDQSPVAVDHGADFVEFLIECGSGSRAIVKVPIRDVAALQAAVQGIMAGMRTDSPERML